MILHICTVVNKLYLHVYVHVYMHIAQTITKYLTRIEGQMEVRLPVGTARAGKYTDI